MHTLTLCQTTVIFWSTRTALSMVFATLGSPEQSGGAPRARSMAGPNPERRLVLRLLGRGAGVERLDTPEYQGQLVLQGG